MVSRGNKAIHNRPRLASQWPEYFTKPPFTLLKAEWLFWVGS